MRSLNLPQTVFRRGGFETRPYNILIPLIVYTLAAIFITWPLVTQLSTHAAGAGYGDSFEYIRLGWWGKYALQNGLNPFYQSLFAYPDGFFSAVQWAQPLIYWPTALLGFVFDPVAAFNIWLLLEIILSGLTAYWLCREVVWPHPLRATGGIDSPSLLAERGWGGEVNLPALLGGLIFMAFPAVQGHLSAGHVNPLSNYALPVVVLCLFRLLERDSGLRTAILGAVALLILALGNFTFPAFTLLPLVLFGGGYYLLFRRRHLLRRHTIRNLLIMFIGGALLTLPFYITLFNDLTASNRPAYLQETGWVRYSTDPLSFIAPSPFTLWTARIAPAYSRTVLGTNSIEGTAYLGIVAIILTVIALWKRRRAAGVWLALALGCMLFSLGPLLKWQDQPVTYRLGSEYQSYVVMPWSLFQNMPLISATRTPGRFNITTGLALGVLAALGLSTLTPNSSPSGRGESKSYRVDSPSLLAGRRGDVKRIVIVAVLIVLVLLEYQLFFPFPTTSAWLPTYFESLAKRADVRAVFDVPADDLIAQKVALYQQVAHHKPLVAGYISRRTPVDPAKLKLLSDMVMGKLPPFSPALDANAARAILKDNGVDVVVYHWRLGNEAEVGAYAKSIFGQAVYRDDQGQRGVFEVPQATQATDAVAITLSEGGWWYRQPGDDLIMTGDASLYLYTAAPLDRQLSFTVAPLRGSFPLQFAIDGQIVRANIIQSGQAAVWLRLPPGFHTLRFIAPGGCVSAPVRLLGAKGNESVCASAVFSNIRLQPAEAMAFQEQPVQLSQGMALSGYRAAINGQALSVETTWRAAQKLPRDYHVFIHILDQNEKLIAQADTTPGAGTFPTSQWSVPQTWIEHADISLPAVLPPGKYGIYAGWYSYPDLTRLIVEGNAPHAPDGLVCLREIEIR